MKKSSIFAAFKARTILRLFVCVAVFFATNTAGFAAEYRLSISNGCCAAKPVIVLARTEKDSLSSFKYFNFSFMARTMKDYSGAKHSNANVTLFNETEIQLKQATNLPEITQVLIQVCEQLSKKTELHVHFVINSVINNRDMNYCDIVIGNDIELIGHKTFSVDSPIEGNISTKGGLL